MTLPFRFNEMPGSGNSTALPPSREKQYYAVGSIDESFVMNVAIGATPAIIATPQG